MLYNINYYELYNNNKGQTIVNIYIYIYIYIYEYVLLLLLLHNINYYE